MKSERNIELEIFNKHQIRLSNLDVFIMTDQPPCCSNCNKRADILEEFIWRGHLSQLCQCNNKNCSFVFVEQEDDYFNLNYWLGENLS